MYRKDRIMANAKGKDQHSDAVASGASDQAEEMRRARRDQSNDPSPEAKADFPVESSGDAVWVANRNGGVHDVPGDWVTEDDMGIVRVRGNLGYRYANDQEISQAREAQNLDTGNAKATDGSQNANAEKFEVVDTENAD